MRIFAVGDPPKLVENLSDLSAISPEPVSLECKINLGDPVANIKWFRDNKEITKNKKYEMSQIGEVVALAINEAEPSDSATYRCEAKNKLGQVKTQCKLTVQS